MRFLLGFSRLFHRRSHLAFPSRLRCAAPRFAVHPPRRLAGVALPCLLSCLAYAPAYARQSASGGVEQRDINEMAAGTEQVRRLLLEDTHLRRPGEDLGAYLRRLASPLPAELKTQYFTRVNSYLRALAQSADATQAGRRLPPLRDTSAFNRAQWERALRALQILPVRVNKTQAAWQRVQAHYSSVNNMSAPTLFGFDAQFQQTAQVIIAADDALHNARP